MSPDFTLVADIHESPSNTSAFDELRVALSGFEINTSPPVAPERFHGRRRRRGGLTGICSLPIDLIFEV